MHLQLLLRRCSEMFLKFTLWIFRVRMAVFIWVPSVLENIRINFWKSRLFSWRFARKTSLKTQYFSWNRLLWTILCWEADHFCYRSICCHYAHSLKLRQLHFSAQSILIIIRNEYVENRKITLSSFINSCLDFINFLFYF